MVASNVISIDRVVGAEVTPSRGSLRRSNQAASPTLTFEDYRHAAGNLAFQGLLRSRTVQAKQSISQPDDMYEQEADKVAEQVMRSATVPSIQRKCAACT